MKITQQHIFQPITITLETADETDALWDAIRKYEVEGDDEYVRKARKFCLDLNNWFSNHAQLGG